MRFQVRNPHNDDIVELIIRAIDIEFRTIFSKVYPGSDAIEFENNFFSFLMRWNFFEIISYGNVSLKKNKTMTLVAYNLSYAPYFIFWILASLVLLASLFVNDENLLLCIGAPLLWVLLTYLFSQIAILRFNSRILSCIKKTGAEKIN